MAPPPPGGIRTHNPSKRAALDRAATGIGTHLLITKYISKLGAIRTPCNVNTRM